MTSWGDLVSRARGLSTHVLTPTQLAGLAASRDMHALAGALAALGAIPAMDGVVDASRLEHELRRRAAARLRVLAKWAGTRREQLAPLFLDEDRLILRALLRGAAAGLPPEARNAGLVPTVTLPMRAINQLAAAGDVASIGAMLLAWRHPFGALVATEATRQRPDLLHLEMALVRSFAESARGAARDGALRRYVRTRIDVANAWAALALATQRADVAPADLFVPGGALITADNLAEAVATRSCATLAAQTHARAPHSAPDVALSPPAGVSAEDAVCDAMVRDARAAARRDPLGLAPVILLVLRTRAELQALHRIVWSIELGVPAPTIAARIRDAA